MKEYSVWLLLRPHLSRQQKVRLMEALGGAGGVFEADESRLREVIPTLSAEALRSLRDRDLSRAQELCRRMDRLGGSVVDYNDYDYPPLLRQIADPPLALFVRGELPRLTDRITFGIVGQRRATVGGRKTAAEIAYGLSKNSVIVVSGMAAGIDGAAHKGALDGGSPTIAVFGTAIDKCYPAEHASLMRRIIENGAVVSEYPPGFQTYQGSFVQRNRIISGMSRGVLVVEARQKSGSLITAQRALEQNRDVFAVPGPADAEDHMGTNRLIKDGAAVAVSARDILEVYATSVTPVNTASVQRCAPESPPKEEKQPAPAPKQTGPAAGDDTESAILKAVGKIAHADEIAERTGIPTGELMARLTMMEIKGLLARRPGNYFEVKNRR